MTKLAPLRVLLWHVHGSWTEAFVRGDHRYFLPTLTEGGPWGRGLSGRDWPAAEELRLNDIAHVKLRLGGEVAADAYAQCHATGAFILIDEATNDTVAAGMIRSHRPEGDASGSSTRDYVGA